MAQEERIFGELHKIGQKISSLDTKISVLDDKMSGMDEKISHLDDKIDSLALATAQRFDESDGKIDKVIRKVVEMDEKLDTMATQEYVDGRFDEVVSVLDEHTVLLRNLDHDRLSMHQRLNRIDNDVEILKSRSGAV